jgi:hypothetical protein
MQTYHPFLMNPELKIYIFPHILSLTSMQDVYTLAAPLHLMYIGICAIKCKMKLGFHVMTGDLRSLAFHILEMFQLSPSVAF